MDGPARGWADDRSRQPSSQRCPGLHRVLRGGLAPLEIRAGYRDGAAVGFFGPEPGSFWISPAQRAEDRELHIAFAARSRDEVHAFHRAAVALGAEVLHAPRLFPEYDADYYAAFVRDPDGHNIEAVCRRAEGTPGVSPREGRPLAPCSSRRRFLTLDA